MKTYVIADLHFFHQKIIEYTNRPFENVYSMNQYMIEQWNSVVNDEDTVLILGDFGFGSVDNLTYIVSQLKGYKILVMGNHDRHRSVSWWLNLGFDEVYKKPIEHGDYLLSHEPKDVADKINIHGHLHNTPLPSNFNPETHICVSVEMTDYKPLLLEDN